MSSTRRAAAGSPLHQNRFMSDPEFAAQRGISGTAVAAKASLLLKEEREQAYFYQSISLVPDPLRMAHPDEAGPRGIKRAGAAVVEMFPDRLGSPLMHKIGMRLGQKYNTEQARQIRAELGLSEDEFPLRGDLDGSVWSMELRDDRRRREAEAEDSKKPTSYPASVFVDVCRKRALAKLPDLLTRLCIDPRLRPALAGKVSDRDAILDCLVDEDDGIRAEEIKDLSVAFFHDLTGALFEYQRRYAERIREQFVMTSIAKPIFEALDYALENRKMVLIRGNSGVGKSESNRTWAEMHRGEARWVSMKGINHRTGFFRTLAKSLGVGCTPGLSPAKVQARVEDFLEKTRMMLVIDEAQYLWPQQKRIEREPELVNWLMTVCFNQGIPVAMIATKAFDRRRQAVEEQTEWSAEQLSRRIKRAIELPEAPTLHDLQAVARKQLPEAADATIKLIVGYAMASKRFMDGVKEVIEDAAWLAKGTGRSRITYDDVKRAIAELRSPSDASLKRVLTSDTKVSGKRRRFAHAAPVQPDCNADAGSVDNAPEDSETADDSGPVPRTQFSRLPSLATAAV